jgi:hypothetical protein
MEDASPYLRLRSPPPIINPVSALPAYAKRGRSRDACLASRDDSYRLIVQREGERVRLLSRNGNDWSGRYQWIVEGRADEQAQPVCD